MENAVRYSISDEVIDFLVTQPTLEQMAEFKASETAKLRLRYLLDANRGCCITSDERAELDEYNFIIHFMIMLKAKACLELMKKA